MSRIIKNLLFSLIFSTANGFLFAEGVDTSEAHLDKLVNVYEYYFFQNQLEGLPEKKKQAYAAKLNDLEKRILQIENGRADSEWHEGRTKLDSAIIKNIITLLPESKPVYAHEQKSMLINLGTSFAGFSYFQPVYISFEKSCLGDKVSLGAYTGFFTEKRNSASSDNYEEHTSYTFTKQIYRYNYLSVGLKGSYHLLNIEPLNFGLNPKVFDLYATAVVGYSLAFLKADLANNTVPYEAAQKEGINYGAMLGVRFFYDDNLNLFAEAGYSRIAYLNLGIGYRFLPASKDKNIE